MKVVTFNLRCDVQCDGENRWQFRKGLVLDKIEEEQPDLIGFQEGSVVISTFLKHHLTDYICVGCGRNADFSGENNMIAFRKDRFELMFLETFWLSPTPWIPGSRYASQSEYPRICTHVILRPLNGEKLFHYYNTHLDHISDEARTLGASAIMRHMEDDLKRSSLPVILTGDMNAAPDSMPIKTFLSWETVSLINQTPDFPASFHDYGRAPDHPQIDYIFTGGFRAVKPSVRWNECPYGKHLSDHDPLCAELIAL